MKNKNFKTYSLIFVFAALFTFSGMAQEQSGSVTLTEVIKMALTNQPLLKQAEEQINAAEARINQQKTFYYPNIEGDISYTRIGPIPSFVFGGSNLFLAPANNYDAHVSASQLLYDFGKRDALINLAKSYKLTAENKINLIKNNLAFQTAGAFYTIIFLEKSIQVKEEQLNTLGKHIEITEKKVQSGSATDYDILTTKVRVAEVQNQKIDLENNLKKAKIYLKSLMGWQSGEKINPAGNFKIDSSLFNTDSLVIEAFNNRPEMIIAKDAEQSASLTKHLESLSDRPMLNLIVSYGFKNGYEPNLNVLRGNWAAGVNASIPIFNGGLKDSKVEEAEANVKLTSDKLLELERNIKSEVEQAVTDFNSNNAKIQTAELQVEQAKQAVSRAQIRYRDGVITNLDLIDAETSLSEAELQYIQVLYRNVINSFAIDQAVGKKLW